MIRTTSARIAITIATGNGWTLPDGVGGGDRSNIGGILHGLDCGRVLAALDTLPPHLWEWAALIYGAPGFAPVGIEWGIHDRVVDAYLALQERKPKDTSRVERLALVAMHDYKMRQTSDQKIKPADAAAKIGFDNRDWGHWSKRLQEAQQIMQEWDRDCLRPVARLLHAEDQAA